MRPCTFDATMVQRYVQAGWPPPGINTGSPSQSSRPSDCRKSSAQLLGLRPAVPSPAVAEPLPRCRSSPSPAAATAGAAGVHSDRSEADIAITPYGVGNVCELRPSKGIVVMQFPWGKGYFSRSCVKKSPVSVLESRLHTLASVFAVLVQPCAYLLEPAIEVFYAADEKSWNQAAESLLLWLKQVVAAPELSHRGFLQEVEKILDEIMHTRAQLDHHYSGGTGNNAELVAEAVKEHLEAVDACERTVQRAADGRRRAASRDVRVLELEQSQEFGKLRTLLEALDADLFATTKAGAASTRKLCGSMDKGINSRSDKQLVLSSPLPTTSRLVAMQPFAAATPLQPSSSSQARQPDNVGSSGANPSDMWKPPPTAKPPQPVWSSQAAGRQSNDVGSPCVKMRDTCPSATTATPLQTSWSSKALTRRPDDVGNSGGSRHTSPHCCKLQPGELIWPGALPGAEPLTCQAPVVVHVPCNPMRANSGNNGSAAVLLEGAPRVGPFASSQEDSFACPTSGSRAPSPARITSGSRVASPAKITPGSGVASPAKISPGSRVQSPARITPGSRALSPLRAPSPPKPAVVLSAIAIPSGHFAGSCADEAARSVGGNVQLLSPLLQPRQCADTGSFATVVRCVSPVQSPIHQSSPRSGGGCHSPSRSRSGTPARACKSHVLCPTATPSPTCSPPSPGRCLSSALGNSCAAGANVGVGAVPLSRAGTPRRSARANVHQGSPAGSRITTSAAIAAPMSVGPIAAVVAQVRPLTPATVVRANTPVIMAQPVCSGGGQQQQLP